MTMPGARTLSVDGRDYQYVLKRPKRFQAPDWAVRLVLLLRSGKYITLEFKTEPADPTKEQSGFSPALVTSVIRALEFHQGKLPEGFQVGDWRLEPSAQNAQAADD